jgi:hypothetical protein
MSSATAASLVTIRDDDLRAFVGEQTRNALAHSSARARNDRHLILQTIHPPSLRFDLTTELEDLFCRKRAHEIA